MPFENTGFIASGSRSTSLRLDSGSRLTPEIRQDAVQTWECVLNGEHANLTTALLCACQFLNQVGLDPESRPGEHRALMVRVVRAMLEILIKDENES